MTLIFDMVETLVNEFLCEIATSEFHASKALDVRYGRSNISYSTTLQLTKDGAQYTGSAGSIGAEIFALHNTVTFYHTNEKRQYLAYGTSIKDLQIVIVFCYEGGQLETAKKEFDNIIAIFNARYNSNYAE